METVVLEQFLSYFFFYSAFGWTVETVYKSVEARRFMNTGFLYGPYVPIYGFGAVISISADILLSPVLPFGARLVIYTLCATMLEYFTDVISEQIFGVRLWDYSGKRFNLHGRICFQFSLYWLLLNALNMTILYPFIAKTVSAIPIPVQTSINRVLLAMMLVDFIFACRNLRGIVRFFNSLGNDYLAITKEYYCKSIGRFRRLLSSFPNLKTYLAGNIRDNLLKDFNSVVKDILGKGSLRESNGAAIFSNGNDDETEFHELVDDILDNATFQRLRDFRHHGGSILDHVKSVAYVTYRYCRTRNLDYRSATRAAMLHDFFLYDWRSGMDENGVHHKGHIYLHPKMALENAGNHFQLNDMERDIILNHMWPLSPSIPKFKETFVVSFVDKFVATREFFEALRKIPAKWS